MTYEIIDELPKRVYQGRRPKRSARECIDNFMTANAKYAKVTFEPDEYKDMRAARGSVNNVCIHSELPLYTTTINGEIYIVREDL